MKKEEEDTCDKLWLVEHKVDTNCGIEDFYSSSDS